MYEHQKSFSVQQPVDPECILINVLVINNMSAILNDRRRRRRQKLLLLWKASRNKNKRKAKQNTYRNSLNAEGRHRRDRNIPRNSLAPPSHAAWRYLYDSGDDGALITVTGFDHATFSYILSRFEPYYNSYTPWVKNNDGFSFKKVDLNKSKGRGRKRMVTCTACLGLVLAWFRFRGSEFILQGWFGFTGSQLNVWLRFGRRMLLKAMSDMEECVVRFPDDATIAMMKEAVAARHKTLRDVYCFADGLKIHFESCHGLSEQSMYYNGWQHGHYITNLFVFGANGRIINCVTNVPGSVHDSTLAILGGTYQALEEIHERNGGICCVDSAFASGDVPYLLRSAQDKTQARDALHMQMIIEATSLRQAAEWGMRAIQSAMPRLKDAMHYEENGERKRVMKLVPLLYNLRLARVGLKQIANTYIPNLSRDADYYIKSTTETQK